MSDLDRAAEKQNYVWQCTEAVSRMASILPDDDVLEVIEDLRDYLALLVDAVKSRKPKESNSWE